MTTREYANQFLTATQQDLLSQLALNQPLRDALKTFLLGGIYSNGTLRAGIVPDPLRNAAFKLVANADVKNEDLGADLRGLWEGINSLGVAFDSLDMFLPQEKVAPKEQNKAR